MRGVLAMVVLVGCGDAALEPDAPPPIDLAPFVPGPNVVRLDTFGTFTMLRYRDGKGPWTEPVASTPDVYELHVTDSYEVLVSCSDTFGFNSTMYRRTVADGDTFAYCFSSAFVPTTVTVGGSMQQSGMVSMYDVVSSPTGPWQFSLQVPRTMHDLIAVGDTHMAIRRGIAITDPTTLPTIDLDQEGAAIATTPLSLNKTADETVETRLWFETIFGLTLFSGTPTAVRHVPASLLEEFDTQELDLYVSGPRSTRTLYAPYTGTQSGFQLMPLLEDVTFSFSSFNLVVQWDGLPDYDELTFDCYDYFGGWTTVVATKRWIDASPVKFLAFDDLPIDYDPRLKCATGGPYIRELVARENRTPARSTAITERQNGARETPRKLERFHSRSELDRATRRELR